MTLFASQKSYFAGHHLSNEGMKVGVKVELSSGTGICYVLECFIKEVYVCYYCFQNLLTSSVLVEHQNVSKLTNFNELSSENVSFDCQIHYV